MTSTIRELQAASYQRLFNLRLHRKRFPFVGLTLAAMSGILFEEVMGVRSCWLLGAILLIGGLQIAASRWKTVVQTFFVYGFIAVSFALLHVWQWQEAPARKWAHFFEKEKKILLVEGIINSDIKVAKQGYSSFIIKVAHIELPSGQVLTPSIMMLVHWEGAEPHCGDRIRFRAEAFSPTSPKNPGEFDAVLWLARQEIYTELKMDPSDPGEIIASGYGSWILRHSIVLRHWAEKTLEQGMNQDASMTSLIKAVVLGVKEKEVALDDFQLTGTMHLFAVSGLHVGMLAMIVWFCVKLFRLPLPLGVVLSLGVLFSYVMTTGGHIGSWRAGIMASLVFVGFLLCERPLMFNSLAAAAFLLLACETNLLFSMGWQFSFSVVVMILLLAAPLERWLRPYYESDPFLPKKLLTAYQKGCFSIAKHLAQLASVSLAAWIGALVPSVIYFHTVSFSALGANLFAVPLAFMILLTALLSLLSGILIPSIAVIFNNANWFFAKILLLVVHGFAMIPYTSFSVGVPTSVSPRLTLFDFPSASAAILQVGEITWCINTGRTMNATKTLIPFLEKSGIHHLEGLVLTSHEAAVAGGAKSLFEFSAPSQIMATPGSGHALFFRRFEAACAVAHRDITPLSTGRRIDFSKECWGEVFSLPAEVKREGLPEVILKLHLKKFTYLMIPTEAAGVWFLTQASHEQRHADIITLSWKNLDLIKEEGLLASMAPQVLILPDFFLGEESGIHEEEKKLLQRHGIRLVRQHEAGAIIFDAYSEEAKVTEFLNKSSFLIKCSSPNAKFSG